MRIYIYYRTEIMENLFILMYYLRFVLVCDIMNVVRQHCGVK